MKPMTRGADVVIARAITVGLVSFASASAACRCEDPPRPPVAVAETIEAEPVVVPPAVEPQPERTRDGVAIAPTLVRQLASPSAAEPEPRAIDGDLGVRCALGCALVDANGRVVLVQPRDVEEDGVPGRIVITTLSGSSAEEREIGLEGLGADALEAFAEEGGTPPWAPLVVRALGAGPHRPLPDLVAARARTIFSLDEYAPLVALRAPLAERWLYAEVGPTAYRLHLLRADRSVDRLLASLPLIATACDGDATDRACIAPMSIDGAFLAPDARTLHVLVGHPAAGHASGSSEVVSVGLDDASALPTLYDEAARSAELERSLRAPGARTTPFASLEAEPATREARCLRGCALYRENGDTWVVRPTRIERGEVVAARVFAPGPDTAGLEVLGLDHADDDAARAVLLARALAEAPSAEGRALVARQALSATGGIAAAARVELRAPHVGAQLSIDVDASEYVIRWGRDAEAVEVARVPAILLDGDVSAPSLLEVFAPLDRGFPLVIVGVAASRGPADPDGIVHQSFHAIVTAPPPGAADPTNGAPPSRIRRSP